MSGAGSDTGGGSSRATESLMSVILVCWAAVFLAYFARGDLSVFVAPFFRPLIAVAGIVLAVIGFLLCLLPRATASCCHCAKAPHDAHGHSHAHGPDAGLWIKAVVLLLPIGLLFFVRPEGFSATTVRNRGILRATPPVAKKLSVDVREPRAAQKTEPRRMPGEAIFSEPDDDRAFIGEGGVEELTVYDILVLAGDSQLRQKLAGTRVRVLGQIVPNQKNPGAFDLVRMFVVCCAADARVLGLRVEGKGPSNADEMDWIEVDGSLEFEKTAAGANQPFIRANRIHKAEEPDEPFLY